MKNDTDEVGLERTTGSIAESVGDTQLEISGQAARNLIIRCRNKLSIRKKKSMRMRRLSFAFKDQNLRLRTSPGGTVQQQHQVQQPYFVH